MDAALPLQWFSTCRDEFLELNVGMVHAIGHSIGAICHVARDMYEYTAAYGLEYNLHKTGHLTGELLFPLKGAEAYNSAKPEERPLLAIAAIRGLNAELRKATGGKHPTCLKEIVDRNGNLMVPRESLPDIAKLSLNDGAMVYNPEDLDYNDMLMVLENLGREPLDRRKIRKVKRVSCEGQGVIIFSLICSVL
jgi:alcohol dehydrogenase